MSSAPSASALGSRGTGMGAVLFAGRTSGAGVGSVGHGHLCSGAVLGTSCDWWVYASLRVPFKRVQVPHTTFMERVQRHVPFCRGCDCFL